MNEEVIAKFGGDTSPIDRAMEKLKDRMKEWGKSVGESIKEAFKPIASALTFAGIMEGMRRTLEEVKSIKRAAESIGVSTGFIQDIQNVGKSAGISGEAIEKMMRHFVVGLPAGADVEKSFFAMVDSLSKIPDPAERARAAVEAFGKSGLQIVSIAKNGSAGLKEFAASFQKFSDSDIRAIEDANMRIEQATNRIIIATGKFIHAIQAMAMGAGIKSANPNMSWKEVGAEVAKMEMAETKAIKEREEASKKAQAEYAKTHGDPEAQKVFDEALKVQNEAELKALGTAEKLAKLNNDRALFQKIFNDNQRTDLERANAYLGVQKISVEIADTEKKLKQEAAEASRKQLETEKQLGRERMEAARAQMEINRMHQRLVDAAQYRPSVETLAQYQGPGGNIARQILARRDLINAAYAMNRPDIAKQQIGIIEGYDQTDFFGAKQHVKGLNEILRGAGLTTQDDKLQDMADSLNTLVDAATEKGLKIDLPD